MKSLLLLVGLAGVAYADKFPASGPCDDVDACEKACKASTKGACYWGGVLTLQGPFDEEQHKRGLAMFDKACAKNDADACWQSANLVWQFESKELKTAGPKTYAAFQKACNKNHARACMRLGDIAAAAEDAKSKKLAVTVKVKGAKLLEQRCTKAKLVRACTWAASLYESGEGVKQDAKKATALRDKRCMIETGSKCPPPEPPPPPSRPMTKGMD
jgi:TPR repeat protein